MEPLDPPEEEEIYSPAVSQLTIEASYLNIAEGNLNWSKVSKFVDDECVEIRLRTDDGQVFLATRKSESGVVATPHGELREWFRSNRLQAGCLINLSRTENENEVEIAFDPTPTEVKRCLLAAWNEEEQRVELTYEDISVDFKCSEHLFRSSVNLGDSGVLEHMARLYGSIFDVLYLGMRDLFNQGLDTTHYRDLHNMVLDKRLHPQLGSVFVELSKNPNQFERMGGGYWRFIPDERIEAIIRRLFESKMKTVKGGEWVEPIPDMVAEVHSSEDSSIIVPQPPDDVPSTTPPSVTELSPVGPQIVLLPTPPEVVIDAPKLSVTEPPTPIPRGTGASTPMVVLFARIGASMGSLWRRLLGILTGTR